MNDNKGRKVALFVCHELLGLLMLNKVVPAMKMMGLEPVIFNAKTARNRKTRYPGPPIAAALNVHLLDGVIIPFLENERHGKGLPNLTYRQLAAKHGLQYYEICDPNDPALVKRFAEDAGYVGAVSMRFMLIFSQPIIDVFRTKGFMWNLHSGLLPDYKGMLLPYRAIENGEKEYGLTLHEMTIGLDEGAIVSTGTLPLDPCRSIFDLYFDTVDTAVNMVTTALSGAAQGRPPKGTPQNGPGNYYSNPTAEECLRYMERGITYIDPNTTLRRIADAFAGAGTARSDMLAENIRLFLEGKPLRADSPATLAEAV